MDAEGFVHMPELPGIGYKVDTEYLNSLVYEKRSFVVNSRM
jgi:hypothetical protein